MTYPKMLETSFYADSSSIVMLVMTGCCMNVLLPTARCGLEFTLSMVNCSLVSLNLSVASERILRKERKISNLWNSLPYVALGAFDSFAGALRRLFSATRWRVQHVAPD